MVEIFRPVDDHSNVAALSRKTSAASSRMQRRSELPTGGYGFDHVLLGLGNDHPDRYLAVVGAIGGIERLAAGIEANLARDCSPQFGLQPRGIDLKRVIPPR